MDNEIKILICGMYAYLCKDCGEEISCYVEKKLFDNNRPTPFMDKCPVCGGTIQDATGFKLLPNSDFPIKEFKDNRDYNPAVYLLLDKDIKEYGDMACGNLHINVDNKLVSVHDLKFKR